MGDTASVWITLRGVTPGGSAAEQRTCLKAALAPAQRRDKNAREKQARDQQQYIDRLERALHDQGDRKAIEERIHEQQLRARAEEAERARVEALRKRACAEAEAAATAADVTMLQRTNTELQCKVHQLETKEKELATERKLKANLEKRLVDCRDARQQLMVKCKSAESESKRLCKQNTLLQTSIGAEVKMREEAEREMECQMQAHMVTIERLGSELAVLHQWKQENRPARGGGPQAKPIAQVQRSQRDERRRVARENLVKALSCADLRGEDVAQALEQAEKIDLIFETRQLWTRKMAFAQDLCDTIGSVWNADLSMYMRDDYALSERIMDGIRFDLSHEVINGRPRPRMLVADPYSKKRINFPQPIKSRCAWTQRMRDRDEARAWIECADAETTERDFDKTLDELVARDESLLRSGFSAVRPFAFCIGFDGADNFTHVTLRITDYKDGVAAESELKAKQLAVAMGDDHYPRLEKVIKPLIGPAASARTSVNIGGKTVPAVATMCLDLSAGRSAYGRRSGKSVWDQRTDVHTMPKIPEDATPKEAFAIVDKFAKWNVVEDLNNDAHSPSSFPFCCKRKGCAAPAIRDAAHREELKKELQVLKADKTKKGKDHYAKVIATFCDAHGQQMPFQQCVTSIPLTHLIADLLHMLDLNLPKVDMKYSLFDPKILTPDMRTDIGEFLSEIGCPLDIRDKENRDKNKKWFHGSVWHYDFVLGANRKSFGLQANIFQLCLIVYGVKAAPSATPSATPSAGAKRKQPATPAIINDFSDDEFADDDEADEGDADLDSGEVMSELRAFFGANAEKVKAVLELWNAYAELYNALCDDWTDDSDAYREERAFRTLKAGLAHWEKINDVSTRRHKSDYFGIAALVASRQQKMWGDLWRFSTRSVEGRGGQLKRIGRRMICWRRRSKAKYRRTIQGKGGEKRIIEQSYNSAPERQLMRAACNREDRAHMKKRSRVATTGRNTLARTFDKMDDSRIALGTVMEPETIKRLCSVARSNELAAPEWRMQE